MCYILAKDVNKHGCVAFKTKFGNELDGVAAINLSQMSLSQEECHWNSIRPQSNIFNS